MTAPTHPPKAPMERLSALAARGFADPGEAIAAILDLARDLLGLTTALVTRSDGETWRAVHVADAAFGLAPGATFPLRDTFCSLVGADEPVVITDAPNDPRGGLVAAPARLDVRTFVDVPLVLRDGTLYGTLCAFDARASDLGGEAVAALRILARLVVHELEHDRQLTAVRDEEEQRFRALVRNAPDLITILDANGAVHYESPAIERVLGYGPDELVGENALALVHPADLPRVGGLFAECLAAPGVNLPAAFRLRHKDGSWRWLEAVGTNLLADPAVGGIVVNSRDVTDRRRAEAALRESEVKYRTLVERLPAVVYSERLLHGDPAAAPRYVSPQVAALLGYSQAEWLADPVLWKTRLHPDDRDAVYTAYAAAERAGGPFRGEYRLIDRDGRTVWVRDEAVQVRDEAGRPRFWQGFMLDVTERKAAEAALQASEERFRALVRNSSDVILVVDAAGAIRFESPALERVLGYAPEALIGTNPLALVHPDDVPAVEGPLAALQAAPEATIVADVRHRHRDGTYRDLEVTLTNLLAEPAVEGIVVNARDVSERKRAEERLTHLAYHDPLTGLPNRGHFLERLDRALARARRGAGPVAVLLLDLDGFKLVNDSHGHHAGDELLVEAGRRLRGCLSPASALARLGGDEFAVLLKGIADADEAARVAERLIAALRPPVVLDDGETYVNASVGIAVSTRRRSRPVDLLRSADIAPYRAKAVGRGTHVLFEPRMQAPVTERLERETALRRALERGELRLHYQPKVELATGRVVGVEALARWAHPERGLLPPVDFIRTAEETGLIVPLGGWVLREACR